MCSSSSPLLLLGVGTAGATVAKRIAQMYGAEIRLAILDTDAVSGLTEGVDFVLLGANRFNGNGTGRNVVEARYAFQDNPQIIDSFLSNIRIAVVVTCLGGGTGSGVTSELLKYLHDRGIATITFATTPFAFEGESALSIARSVQGSIVLQADATILLALDDLVKNPATDNMKESLEFGLNIMAQGVTLFWRVLEKPGFIRFDTELLRNHLANAGLAFFATAAASGPDREQVVFKALVSHPLLKWNETSPAIRFMMLGILAGDDLRLQEVGYLSEELNKYFKPKNGVHIGTVNDEQNYANKLSAVILLFEETSGQEPYRPGRIYFRNGQKSADASDSRLGMIDKSTWKNIDLDVPTFIRWKLTLDP